jgi:hypothetical protein
MALELPPLGVLVLKSGVALPLTGRDPGKVSGCGDGWRGVVTPTTGVAKPFAAKLYGKDAAEALRCMALVIARVASPASAPRRMFCTSAAER